MVNLGDRIEVTGIGRLYIRLIPGATGIGRVIHVGRDGVTESYPEFTRRDEYEQKLPAQFATGIFYMDEGLSVDNPFNPLPVVHEDARVIPEEEPENEE